MGMEQREAWSINRLATELQIDRRSLARRLGHVEPAAKGPKGEPLYRLRDALDALGESPVAAPGSNGTRRIGGYTGGDLGSRIAERRLYERGGPMATMTGEEVCSMFRWGWPELGEILGWGSPFIRAGSQRSTRGWIFAFPHFAIWLADLADELGAPHDLRRVAHLLRDARGSRPLRVPTGFREFRVDGAPRRATKAAT